MREVGDEVTLCLNIPALAAGCFYALAGDKGLICAVQDTNLYRVRMLRQNGPELYIHEYQLEPKT